MMRISNHESQTHSYGRNNPRTMDLIMDQRGLPLREPHIRRMAQILLNERVSPSSTTVQSIGKC